MVNDILICISLLLASYLLGAIPFGLIISKIKKIDLRKEGSGNIGSTNAFRVLGFWPGMLAAFLDVLKGSIIIIITYLLIRNNLYNNLLFPSSSFFYILYGMPAVFGHCFSIYLKFKGGKGVATSLGVVLVTFPYLALGIILVFILVVLITKYVSLGSVIGGALATITSFILFPIAYNNFLYPICLLILLILIVIKHIPNFIRLKNHTENKVF